MSQRFVVIDVVRGFCLLNIFINHISLGLLRELSISKIEMSDSAEIFVFLAGLSVFFFANREWQTSLGRILRRALTLYATNLLIIVATIALLFLIDEVNGSAKIFDTEPLDILQRRNPAEVFASILTFSQSYGYSMVLRLYVFLMLWAPFALWLARRRFWYPLVPALLIWASAGHFDLVIRNEFTDEPFALTLLPWTLVFTCGISLGAAIAQDVALPRGAALIWVASAYVILCVVLVAWILPKSAAVQAWFATRNDHFWLGGSKTYQSPVRVLHLLACVYIFIVGRDLPVIRLFYRASQDNPLCLLGRSSLAVFSVGAVAAVLIDEILYLLTMRFGFHSVPAAAVEVAMVVAVCWAMFQIARFQSRRRARRFKAGSVVSPVGTPVAA